MSSQEQHPTYRGAIDAIINQQIAEKEHGLSNDPWYVITKLEKDLYSEKCVGGLFFLEDISPWMDADEIRRSFSEEEIEDMFRRNPPRYEPDNQTRKKARSKLQNIFRTHKDPNFRAMAGRALKRYYAKQYSYPIAKLFSYEYPNFLGKMIGWFCSKIFLTKTLDSLDRKHQKQRDREYRAWRHRRNL